MKHSPLRGEYFIGGQLPGSPGQSRRVASRLDKNKEISIDSYEDCCIYRSMPNFSHFFKKIKFQLYCIIVFALCVCQPLSADVLPKCMETENTYPIYLKCDDDKIVVICIDKDVGEGSFSATKKVYLKDRLIETVEAHYDDFL